MIMLSGHFCMSLHVGHARKIRLVFNYRITDLEAQIKNKKKNIQECLDVRKENFFVALFALFIFDIDYTLFGAYWELLSMLQLDRFTCIVI